MVITILVHCDFDCSLLTLKFNRAHPLIFGSTCTKSDQKALNKSCQKTRTLAERQPSLNSSQGENYLKVGQTSRSRSRGQKLWYHAKGLVTRNTHVQYENPIISGKKVMAKVKVF